MNGFHAICGSALFFALIGDAMAAPEAPAVDAFFRHEDVRDAELSPSGAYVAVLQRINGKRYGAVVMSTSNPSDAKIVAQSSQADVVRVNWVNDDRLVLMTEDLEDTSVLHGASHSVLSVSRDGSDVVFLITGGAGRDHAAATGSNVVSRVLPASYSFLRVFDWKSDDIIVGSRSHDNVDGSLHNIAPFRLNTRTRELTPLVEPGLPTFAKQWVFDQNGEPRAYMGFGKGRRFVYYRESGSKEWQKIGDFDEIGSDGFAPSYFGYDNSLYVTVGENSGISTLHRFNLKDKTVEKEAVVELEGFDFYGHALMDRGARKLLGYRFLTDAWGTVWIDPRMKALQAKLDKALPSTVNEIRCTYCAGSKTVLVVARSDREPARYLLYDITSEKLLQFASARPAIMAAQMGKREFTTFKARDGLSIPVYVTLPAGKAQGPLPTVVMVHGGPWLRGASWEWSAEPEFLASRGYAVIEPEFRGSVGFGFPLFHAGWKQWGLAMQDDLADAAKWAITKGYADPKRIAIGGASYGGYATLMGLIKNPELFRCGFEWVGVTDIGLMYSLSWNDASNEQLEYGMPILVGDPEKDADQLKATSPLENARRLAQPVLMAYGSLDRRVPYDQGIKFRDAVSASNKNVEWILYPNEGHGWYIEEDDIDFWKRVDHFLEVNLKNAQ